MPYQDEKESAVAPSNGSKQPDELERLRLQGEDPLVQLVRMVHGRARPSDTTAGGDALAGENLHAIFHATAPPLAEPVWTAEIAAAFEGGFESTDSSTLSQVILSHPSLSPSVGPFGDLDLDIESYPDVGRLIKVGHRLEDPPSDLSQKLEPIDDLSFRERLQRAAQAGELPSRQAAKDDLARLSVTSASQPAEEVAHGDDAESGKLESVLAAHIQVALSDAPRENPMKVVADVSADKIRAPAIRKAGSKIQSYEILGKSYTFAHDPPPTAIVRERGVRTPWAQQITSASSHKASSGTRTAVAGSWLPLARRGQVAILAFAAVGILGGVILMLNRSGGNAQATPEAAAAEQTGRGSGKVDGRFDKHGELDSEHINEGDGPAANRGVSQSSGLPAAPSSPKAKSEGRIHPASIEDSNRSSASGPGLAKRKGLRIAMIRPDGSMVPVEAKSPEGRSEQKEIKEDETSAGDQTLSETQRTEEPFAGPPSPEHGIGTGSPPPKVATATEPSNLAAKRIDPALKPRQVPVAHPPTGADSGGAGTDRIPTSVSQATVVAPPAVNTSTFNPKTSSETSQDTKAILQAIEYDFNNFDTMEGEFVQVGPNGERSEGVFFISKPGKVRFQYRSPSRLEVISDGTSVAVRDVRANTQDLYPLSKTPLRYLLVDDINFTSSTFVEDVRADTDSVALVINDSSSLVKGTLTLIFNRETNQLRQWIVTDSGGRKTSVSISKTVTGKPPDPKLFRIHLLQSRAGR